MSAVLLHIGTPKTGTTSFQHWAWTNRSDLEEKSGVRVYEGLFGPNHYEFGLLCKRESRNGFGEFEFPDYCLPEWRSAARAHIRRQVQAAEADGCDLLVSSEVISFLRYEDELASLRGLLEGLEVRPFAVIREPAYFLKSWRRQIGPGRWSAQRSSAGYTEPDSWLVDYPAMRGAFIRAFGGIDVMSYEDLLKNDGSVIPGLAAAMGFEAPRVEEQLPWLNNSDDKPGPLPGPGTDEPMEEIAHLHRRLRSLSAENDGLRTQLMLEERGSLGLRDQSKMLEERVQALELTLRQARDELASAVRERERTSSVVAAMDGSASWKITKPARETKRLVLAASGRGGPALQGVAVLASVAVLAALLFYI